MKKKKKWRHPDPASVFIHCSSVLSVYVSTVSFPEMPVTEASECSFICEDLEKHRRPCDFSSQH